MKHIISTLTIIILSVITFTANAQLVGMSTEEYAEYKTVWKHLDGYIRYMEDSGTYVLLGSTNNRFENTMASIVLGDSKESAILTLNDLQKIVMKETDFPKSGLVVMGYNGKKTTIYKLQGTFAFKTESVAGETYILWHMKRQFDNARQAILDFNDGSESPVMSSAVQESTLTKESTKAAELEAELEELNKEISQNDETIKTLTTKNKELKKQTNKLENLLRERWRLD
jgi:chromosome segregation ATPase